MKRLFLVLLVCAVGVSTVSNASILKGKKVYYEKLKNSCGFTGDVMGMKFTMKEWKYFYDTKTLNIQIKKLCPKSQMITEEKDITNLYDFLITFAKDSGNSPACD